MKLLTSIIPYNVDRGYLQRAIESVLNQTEPCELILEQSNSSCAVNLANALDKVETPYYCVCAEDDWLQPNFAEKMLHGHAERDGIINSGADLVYADAYRWRGDNRTLYRAHYYGHKDLLKSTGIHGGAVAYRTESVRAVGGYDRELTTAEEYDLHLRMSKEGLTFGYVGFAVYNYRIHGNNKSLTTKAELSRRKAYINEIRNKYR